MRSTIKRLPYVRDLVKVAQAVASRQAELARGQAETRDQLVTLNTMVERLLAQETQREGRAPSAYPAGHYYSPIPSLTELEANSSRIWPDPPPASLPGIELNEPGQLQLLTALSQYYHEQPFANQRHGGLRYYFANDVFSYSDALYLHCFLRHLRPSRVIEIGSGFSSAVTLDTIDRFFEGQVTCTFIDPEPERLYSLLTDADRSNVEIIAKPVQDVPLTRFDDLHPNDILFIDGSHVTKTGSDVNHLMFHVLPRLPSGVYIHIHDMFYPFEYPRDWLKQGRAWNEAYLVRAFLMYNTDFEIALFGDYLARFHRDALASLMPLTLKNTGGSLWLRRV